MPTDLPFKIESDYDYILTEADREKFAPKLATDEFWHGSMWHSVSPGSPFSSCDYYRRRNRMGQSA